MAARANVGSMIRAAKYSIPPWASMATRAMSARTGIAKAAAATRRRM